MRAHADDLQDAADGSLVDQLAGEHGAFHVQTLAEVDGVFSPRLLGHFLDLVKLRQGGERRFVREVILAVAHHPHPEGGVVARHRCPRHQVDARVFQDLGLGRGYLRSRELLGEGGRLAGVWVVDPLQLGTGLCQAVAHSVDMPVVETDGGENELAFLARRRRPALWGVAHAKVCGHRRASCGGWRSRCSLAN